MNEILVITLSVRTINLLTSILVPVALGWHSLIIMSLAMAMKFPLTNECALWKSFPCTEFMKHSYETQWMLPQALLLLLS